jgi:hypothetical protein
MNVLLLVESELVREIKALAENPPQCHFVHHKSCMTWPIIEPGLPLWDVDIWTCAVARPLTYNLVDVPDDGRINNFVIYLHDVLDSLLWNWICERYNGNSDNW